MAADHLLGVLADEVAAARQRPSNDPLHLKGPDLHVVASSRVKAALAIRELVAETLAAFDHGRISHARKAAAPIARQIFDELEADRARAA